MTITSKIRPKQDSSHHDVETGGNTAEQPSTGVQPTEPRSGKAQGKHDDDQHQELQKNVSGPGANAKHNPASTGGLHSTGSYTEDPAKRTDRKK